jgi:hypothetical protein
MYFWPSFVLCVLIIAGVHQTMLERRYPTPREWSFLSRWFLRTAMATERDDSSKIDRVLVDWRRVGFFYKQLLERLENESIDGTFLIPRGGDGGILVEGLGQTGFDVSMKSEPWRRGYCEALMGAARVAENLDGYVLDTKRKLAFPKDVMIGLSNPRPKPMPYGYREAPKEEDCEDAYASPQIFYMKILTTEGFSTKQRLDAALAYADWLDFKGLRHTADSMYDWAMDIAKSGLAAPADFVVDKKGVINVKTTEHVSENLLRASTALAVHHASAGNVQAALPIFLSVLRARKDLPAEPITGETFEKKSKLRDETGIWPYYYAIIDWLTEAPYPPRPADGNQRPVHTLKEACEEVGLMTYVGEILYATSSEDKGLSWTRDAVDAAEAIMWVMQEEDKLEGKGKCQECLRTGLNNWKSMARNMAIRAEQKEQEAITKSSWFGPDKNKLADEARRWEEEEAQIQLRIQKTAPLIDPIKPPPSWVASLI